MTGRSGNGGAGGAFREAVIDLSAVSHNVETLRAAVAPAAFMAVVKANAYGHGAREVARAALEGGADWLAVADCAEALELRTAGISAPIVAWLHSPDEDFAAAAASSVDVGINSLDELERAALAGVAFVQLKADTGLNRNGAPEQLWEALCLRAAELERSGGPRVRGIFSHFAHAGEAEDSLQLARFDRALAAAASCGLDPELIHIAATAAAIRIPESRRGMVRVGLGIYGLSPFDDASSADLGLRPAMELSAPIVSVKRVSAGEGVSYGYRHRTSVETTLALIPLGYADGIPRQASNAGPVAINGVHYRVAGTIAMDQFVVDVGDAMVSAGDRAVLFGDPERGAPSVTGWADAAGTINYEIVTRIGQRVARRYLGDA